MVAGMRRLGRGGKHPCLLREESMLMICDLFVRASSGFKLNVLNLKSFDLNLGQHTTSPNAAIGVSIDGSDWVTINATQGTNAIPIPSSTKEKLLHPSVVRINVEGWQNNRINLESVVLNSVRESFGSCQADPGFEYFAFRMRSYFHTNHPNWPSSSSGILYRQCVLSRTVNTLEASSPNIVHYPGPIPARRGQPSLAIPSWGAFQRRNPRQCPARRGADGYSVVWKCTWSFVSVFQSK